jgi:hypothetical protein
MPLPPHGGQGTMSLAQKTSGPPDLMAQDSGGPNQAQLPPFAPPQQGAAQIAVQPAGGLGRSGAGGTAQPPTGTGPTGTSPQDFSGIASALERLAPLMTDADTARNLRWQREVDGDKNFSSPRGNSKPQGAPACSSMRICSRGRRSSC